MFWGIEKNEVDDIISMVLRTDMLNRIIDILLNQIIFKSYWLAL